MQSSFDQQTWELALSRLRSTVDEESFATWLRPTQFHRVTDNKITVSVPSIHCRNWLNSNCRDRIVGILRDVTSHDFDLEFQVREMAEIEQSNVVDYVIPRQVSSEWDYAGSDKPVETPALNFPRNSFLNPKYSFDSFVVGESNRFAHAACRQVADPISKSYNPLFIYGGVGLGKTHLMHAIGHHLLGMGPRSRVLYVTSEQFMNSFIESISSGKQFEFREYYRNVDLLMIDDIQFFSGKERTQTEFFHTFNALYDAGKKIVVSSDRPPKELTTLEDRLRNRFSWGLVVDILPPDLETRIAILRKKANVEEVELPNEVAVYIAERVQSNIRELEGVLVRLRAFSTLHGQGIDIELAKSVLGHLLDTDAPRSIDVDDIVDVVCGYFELKRSDLLGSSRLKKFSNPRHIAQYLTRKLTTLSYPDIAQRFGGRDHTSILHAVRKIDSEINKDENMRNLVGYLTKKVRGSKAPV